MTRHIDPTKRLVQEFNPGQPQLPIDKLVCQYIRQSTLTQVKHNKQSTLLQDVKLTRRLMAYGWPDVLIKKIDTDQGLSGQKRRDERKGLDELYRLVLSGQAGAVAAYDASRLFRDLTRKHYTDFVDMCETHHIVVVTFDTIYHPHIRRDMDALIDKFKDAATFIDEVIHGKLLPAKMQAIEEGQSYGGGAVPLGYYVVVGEDERKHYAIYEPHAQIIRWLYRRYRELHGNLGKLGREVLAMGLTFPPFDGLDVIPHVRLNWTGNGYALRSRSALESILSNPAYIGYYIFNGVIISKHSHDAIVGMDDFLYAYSRLSPITLDGQANTARPTIDRRKGSCDALLENLLTCDGNPVYVSAGTGTYYAKVHNDGWHTNPLACQVSTVDAAFSTALRLLLIELEKRHQQGFQDGLYGLIQQAQTTVASESDMLAGELANVLKGIREAELDKKISLEEQYADGVRDAVRRLKKLQADRAALEAKLAHTEQDKNDLAECQSLAELALDSWGDMKFSTKVRFVRLLVTKATIASASPRFLRLDVVIGTPFYRLLTGFVYRRNGERHEWKDDEEALIRRLYPSAPRLDILKALPLRSWLAIAYHASGMRVVRAARREDDGIDEQLAYADMQLMEQAQISKSGRPTSGTGKPISSFPEIGPFRHVWRSEALTEDLKQECLS